MGWLLHLVYSEERTGRGCQPYIIVPPVKLSTYGRRAFTVSGPVVWNSLPEYIDSFRRILKLTFLLVVNYTRESRRLIALETP